MGESAHARQNQNNNKRVEGLWLADERSLALDVRTLSCPFHSNGCKSVELQTFNFYLSENSCLVIVPSITIVLIPKVYVVEPEPDLRQNVYYCATCA